MPDSLSQFWPSAMHRYEATMSGSKREWTAVELTKLQCHPHGVSSTQPPPAVTPTADKNHRLYLFRSRNRLEKSRSGYMLHLIEAFLKEFAVWS